MTVESVRPAAPEAPGAARAAPRRRRCPAPRPRLETGPRPAGLLHARLRDHGDVVRLKLGPKTVYAVTTPGTDRGTGAQPRLHHRRPAVGVPRRAARQGGRGHRQRARAPASAAHHPARVQAGRHPRVRADHGGGGAGARRRWQPGETIDCTAEAFRIAVRIAARCLLRGDYMDERAERLCVALATVFLGMYRRMVIPAGPLYRLPLPANRKFNRALADMHLVVDEIVAERRASGQKPDDLLTALLDGEGREWRPHRRTGDPRPGRRHSHPGQRNRRLHDHVAAPGPRRTSGTRRQGGRGGRIRRGRPPGRIRRTSASWRTRTMSSSRRCVCSRAVWILTRRAVTETELGGYRIPAGADLVYSPYAIQRDPRSYERTPGVRPRPLASGTRQGRARSTR